MPKFKSAQAEAQWLDQMANFLEEDATYLRGKYSGAKWADRKIEKLEAIKDYLDEKREELDADTDEDEGKLDELDGEPPF